MADVKTQRGGDLLDNFFDKPKVRGRTQTREEVDEEIAIKEELRRNPPKARRESLGSSTGFVVDELAAAAESVSARANAAFESGLTEEAIIILVTAAAPWPKSAKHKLTEEQIRAALQGFRNLKDYLKR